MLNQVDLIKNHSAIIRKINPAVGGEESKFTIHRLVLHVFGSIYLIPINTIQYCRADGNYTRVVLDNGQGLVVSQSLKVFEDKLRFSGFHRIHQSILVQLDRIYKINKESIELIDGTKLALSRRKRKDLISLLN